jgi:hypothetical protein
MKSKTFVTDERIAGRGVDPHGDKCGDARAFAVCP